MSFHAMPCPRWRKSSRCGANGTCVEVAGHDDGIVFVRDGGADDTCLDFTAGEWRRFVAAVRRGTFDLH
ncbi:DUF397 domain-containing protein [Actinomadura violacea]|uniref:DUF397 domain-containing protein n=1 Tax=Actinomadura violacea TaxID=2819934 RepID=A0ABS3SAL7_9ACTN|nr:DUF397 domain-containing protein [Actinomadura violacea]MBO2466064.1 DUF397 domain-containing protein [Actinomadura violacea]